MFRYIIKRHGGIKVVYRTCSVVHAVHDCKEQCVIWCLKTVERCIPPSQLFCKEIEKLKLKTRVEGWSQISFIKDFQSRFVRALSNPVKREGKI